MAAASTLNPKMDFLLDEARSDIRKLADFSGWAPLQQRDRDQGVGGDDDAKRERFQVVQRPGATVAVGAGEDASGAIEADKLAWLLEEARADFGRTASSVTAEVVRTASSVTRKLSEAGQPAASLLARAGSSSGRGGSVLSTSASRMAQEPYAPSRADDTKLSWLVAEAKADVTRAASSLSLKLAKSRGLSRASASASASCGCASTSSREAQASVSEDVDAARREEGSASAGTGTSKKRRNPSTIPAKNAGGSDKASFLMQEAQEDFKKLANFLGLTAYPTSGRPVAAAAKSSPSSSVPKTIEVTQPQEDDATGPRETKLTYHPPAQAAKEEANTTTAESESSAVPATTSAESAVLQAYIDDKYACAEATKSDEVVAAAKKKTKKAEDEDEVPYSAECRKSEDGAPLESKDKYNGDEDFVPITKEDTYSQSDGDGNESDGWDMADDFGGAQDKKISPEDWKKHRGKYRPESSRTDVNQKVEKLLSALGSGEQEYRKKTASEIAEDLIRDAQDRRSGKVKKMSTV